MAEMFWSDDTENVCACGKPVRHYHNEVGLCDSCEDDYLDDANNQNKEDMFTELFD